MVIKKIREIIEKRRQRKAEEIIENEKLTNFRESKEMQKAEQIKKEADRLSHLRQYKHAIEEYNKALEIYPYKENAPFKKPADFLFRAYYNTAVCYYFLNKLNDSIEFFNRALAIDTVDEENKVKALMGKGNCYSMAKQSIANISGAYEKSDFNANGKTTDFFRKLDEKEGLLKMAHDCFAKITGVEGSNADAWYKKGHMEFLIGDVKEAMLSFDNVLMIKKDYENKESIGLFDDIKREKGIKVEYSNVPDTDKKFKTKTGHLVRNKAEKMIANFLFENNLIFQYNMAVSWADKDNFKATFFIPKFDLYLEHFKYDYVNGYQKLMEWRIRQYENNRKRLIYTTSNEERNIEETLKIKLKPYIVL